MTAKGKFKSPPDVEMTLTRVLDAPRDLVFKMWVDPRHLAEWWGPEGFTNPMCEIDVRPGGAIYIDMKAPDGTVYPMTGTFHEIVEPERIVFTAFAEDHDGNRQLESYTVVTFAEERGKTRITVEASAIALVAIGKEMLKGMDQGWSRSLDRLERLVAREGG